MTYVLVAALAALVGAAIGYHYGIAVDALTEIDRARYR